MDRETHDFSMDVEITVRHGNMTVALVVEEPAVASDVVCDFAHALMAAGYSQTTIGHALRDIADDFENV